MTASMSVKEARKLLGADSKDLTDEQVAKLVEGVELLSGIALRAARDKLTKQYD